MLIIAVLASTALVLVTRAYFGTKISPVEMVVQFVIAFAICAGFFYSLRYVSATDYEILNGEVLTKNAITKECGRYWSRSEDPFCLTHRTREVYDGETCSGSGKKRTCHSNYHTEYKPKYASETRYFVKHSFDDIEFERVDDRGSNEPPLFSRAYVGQPVAYPHSYQNWIKAASNSLFHEETISLDGYQDIIPPYPNDYFDIYRVNRFVNVGLDVPNAQQISDKLADALKVLGPQRQMNAIILAVNTDTYSRAQTNSNAQGSNSAVSSTVQASTSTSSTTSYVEPDFAFAVRRAWKGFEKNDAVVFLGVDSSNTLQWVNVLSWSKNEMFNVDLRERLLTGRGQPVDYLKVVDVLKEVGMTSYERRSMKEFEYLKDQVSTPWWVYAGALFLNLIFSISLGFVFERVDLESLWSRPKRYY